MSQSTWGPVVFVFVILCSYSIYYNVYHGTINPHDVLLKDPKTMDQTSTKLAVCVSLRDRLLNVHKQGFVAADSPVHKYWDELNCLAMNLPPIGSTVPSTQQENTENKLPAVTPPAVTKPTVKKPEVSLPDIESLSADTDAARDACLQMKNTFNVVSGSSWGWLSEALQEHWKRLKCDDVSGDDDYMSPPIDAVPPVEETNRPPTSEDVNKQIKDGKSDATKSTAGKACREMKTKYDVVPGKSWGSMDADAQVEWSGLNCDKFFSAAEVAKEEKDLTKQLEESQKKQKKNKKSKKKEGFSDQDWCVEMKRTYKVLPMQSWGHLPKNMMDTWKTKGCDVVFTKLRMDSNQISKCEPPKKSVKQPLIAILAGTTSRKMKDPNINMMSLFTYLFPSLIRSLDCGFNYMFVLGYDKGDKFYDNEKGMKEVKDWFDKNVKKVLKDNGMSITLMPVKINNSIKKPGPVFIGMARAAYEAGADYFYRINDDTEIAGHWPKVFVNSLMSLPAPHGVVGPTCKQGNQGILTHDFVHRTHMEIFEMNYYPPELVDWWMDDWISIVYGYKRTFEAKQSPVVHHTGAHGQRYEVDRDNFKRLSGLVKDGRERIRRWMLKHNTSAEQLREFDGDNFSFKRRQAAPAVVDGR